MNIKDRCSMHMRKHVQSNFELDEMYMWFLDAEQNTVYSIISGQ